MALDWAGGPIEAEAIQNGSEVGEDSACEAHEGTKSTGLRVLKPGLEIVRALPYHQAAKPLKQLVSGDKAFIILQHVM